MGESAYRKKIPKNALIVDARNVMVNQKKIPNDVLKDNKKSDGKWEDISERLIVRNYFPYRSFIRSKRKYIDKYPHMSTIKGIVYGRAKNDYMR